MFFFFFFFFKGTPQGKATIFGEVPEKPHTQGPTYSYVAYGHGSLHKNHCSGQGSFSNYDPWQNPMAHVGEQYAD